MKTKYFTQMPLLIVASKIICNLKSSQIVYNRRVKRPPHLFLLLERFRRSCSPSLSSETRHCADRGSEEAEGEMLSLTTESSLKKSGGKAASKTSGSCVPRLW